MSTTDLDPTSPLARFLAGRPAEHAHGATDAPVDPAGTEPSAGRAAPTSRIDVLGAAGVRGVDRRAAVRHAMLGGLPAVRRDLTVRLAEDADAPLLRFLAERDPAGRAPSAPVLLAESGGVAVAAIGVRDRRVLADPMADTTQAVERLQSRAAALRGPLRRQRWAARLRRG